MKWIRKKCIHPSFFASLCFEKGKLLFIICQNEIMDTSAFTSRETFKYVAWFVRTESITMIWEISKLDMKNSSCTYQNPQMGWTNLGNAKTRCRRGRLHTFQQAVQTGNSYFQHTPEETAETSSSRLRNSLFHRLQQPENQCTCLCTTLQHMQPATNTILGSTSSHSSVVNGQHVVQFRFYRQIISVMSVTFASQHFWRLITILFCHKGSEKHSTTRVSWQK